MGIRYYAYAFDADQAERALADPRSLVSADPLADAWGIPHGAVDAVTNFEQSVPQTEMLYLDKAWSGLQRLTAPTGPEVVPRPAYRMFEGQVTPDELGWISWVRAVMPDDVPTIAADLATVLRETRRGDTHSDDHEYVVEYMERALQFVTQLAVQHRGFVYLIG